jgi:hypothetical protein
VLTAFQQGTGAWGGGLIDNLRGQGVADICNPVDWQAVTDAKGTGLIAKWNAKAGCTADMIAHALNAASNIWVICPDDLDAEFNDIATLTAEGVQYLSGLISTAASAAAGK